MLAGLLYPTSGDAKVWLHAVGTGRRLSPPVRARLGQKNQLWWDLPARESLELKYKNYGIPADRFKRTVT